MGIIKTIGDLDELYEKGKNCALFKKLDHDFMIEYYRRMHAINTSVIQELNLYTPELLESTTFDNELPPVAKEMAAAFQNWFMEADKDNDQIPDYARENLGKGLCAVGKFHGQIALFIPRKQDGSLDADKIRAMAEEIFTKPVLDKFKISEYECFTYFLIELPPSEGPDDHRVEKLIESISNIQL